MTGTFLSRGSHRLGSTSILLSILYPSSRTTRAASLNSAIGRGLRKSKGVGFRGKERSEARHNDFTGGTASRGGPVRRTADPPVLSSMTRDGARGPFRHERRAAARAEDDAEGFSMRMRRGKKEVKDDREPPPRRSRAARFNDPEHSFGKRSQERRAETSHPQDQGFDRDIEDVISMRKLLSDDEARGGRRRPQNLTSKQRSADSDRVALERNPDGSKLSKSRLSYLSKTANGPQKIEDRTPRPPREPFVFNRKIQDSRSTFREGNRSSESNTRPFNTMNEVLPTSRPAYKQTVDNRFPLTIPYTTPASEFLYGTSVVEAALLSRRNPRRKLYKLYIYSGENRENADRDAAMERLAKRNDVSIVQVDQNGIRLMDKMSGGRPHNGYVLETSPLPRLPVTGLGELTAQDGKEGFTVSVDYQSREEAAVNGTENFIPLARSASGRKPFVLLLDSIVDPGNLGGIIRTASFLGVSAIAISTRNSASFTPVVLKASAGASENVVLFSVNKPAGFIADSKLNGWKAYAAVAPSGKRDSSMPPSITTDDLDNPLADEPCILMLGNEGEGLRWNLRSKADIELAIQGSTNAGGVDSLNVSVATGILCTAFLRQNDNTAPRKIFVEEISTPKGKLF
jgi:21S rRNA (GM2251-2'-O)-methyltransferase